MKYIIVAIGLFGTLYAKNPHPTRNYVERNAAMEHVIWDGNQISTIHGNHGNDVDYDVTGNSGLEWPKGSEIRNIFQSGLWIIAGKINGQDDIRSSSAEYISEFAPGAYNGAAESGHIYQIHRAEIEAFLTNDWATFSSMSLMLPQTIIDGASIYTELTETALPTDDFMNWPVEDGAPWFDADGDGVYNPENGDYPATKGDMFHWYVMSDYDEETHSQLWGTPPLGINVGVSMYGFDVPGPAQNTLFVEWEIENAGADTLDSLFIGWWADMDVQNANNDLTGCDPLLNMAYTYSNSAYLNERHVGALVFLQMPIVPSAGDTAWVDHSPVPDFKNLPIYAHSMYIGGDPYYRDPNNAQEAYRYLNGLVGLTGDPFINPLTGDTTRFIYPGNPVTGTGWVDSRAPGDRRQLLSTGPIRMEPGEIQRLAGAIVMSDGIDNMAGIANMQFSAAFINSVWASNFSTILPIVAVQDLTGLNNTESTGPFYMQFRLQPNYGADLTGQTQWLHYGLDGLTDSLSLTINIEGSDTTYVRWLPQFTDVNETDTMRYYVTANTSDGQSLNYPPGAPYNYLELVFGPDSVPPPISEISRADTVHHLLPIHQLIYLEEFKDNRFGHTPPLLSWKINEQAIQSAIMVLDTLLPDDPPFDYPDRYWFGWIDAPPLSIGDSLSYWITSRDSSQNQNFASTDTVLVYSGNHQYLGKWEYYSIWNFERFNNYDWDFFEGLTVNVNASFGWYIRTFVSDWRLTDTLTYLTPLDLSDFNSAWLSTKYSHASNDSCCSEIIEGSFDRLEWFQIDSLSSTGLPEIPQIQVNLEPYLGNNSFYFRIILKGDAGSFVDYHIGNILFHNDSTLVGVVSSKTNLPEKFTLYQNYPNPFNPVTTIKYELPEATHVRLVIIDLLGREAAVLVDSDQPPGVREIRFDAGNLASGMYFYRLTTDKKQITRKMVVLK